jgi:hypothetical protein
MGWTGGRYYVTALSVGAIVCIAASNAGTTSQDLKTGFLVGSTPKLQQYAILAGALASALILGPILLKLNDAGTVYVPAAQVAPHVTTDAAKLTETTPRIKSGKRRIRSAVPPANTSCAPTVRSLTSSTRGSTASTTLARTAPRSRSSMRRRPC